MIKGQLTLPWKRTIAKFTAIAPIVHFTYVPGEVYQLSISKPKKTPTKHLWWKNRIRGFFFFFFSDLGKNTLLQSFFQLSKEILRQVTVFESPETRTFLSLDKQNSFTSVGENCKIIMQPTHFKCRVITVMCYYITHFCWHFLSFVPLFFFPGSLWSGWSVL